MLFFYHSGICVCVCPVPVRTVCGSVTVWLALLPPSPVRNLSLLVQGVAASRLSGCVTTKMTVAMVQMRSAQPPALQISSTVQANQGESASIVVNS